MTRPRGAVSEEAHPALARLARALRDLPDGHAPVRVVAERAGTSKSTVSRILSGLHGLPSPAMARAITKACGGNWKDVEPFWTEAAQTLAGVKWQPDRTGQRVESAEQRIVELQQAIELLTDALKAQEDRIARLEDRCST